MPGSWVEVDCFGTCLCMRIPAEGPLSVALNALIWRALLLAVLQPRSNCALFLVWFLFPSALIISPLLLIFFRSAGDRFNLSLPYGRLFCLLERSSARCEFRLVVKVRVGHLGGLA